MTKEKMVTDLKKIASQINEYADQLNGDNNLESISIRIGVEPGNSWYEVSAEHKV
jgi:hypothetical protein